MTGRRTKYTPETVDKLVQAIRLGATYKLACDYAGITFETFNQWRSSKSEFSDAIQKAEGAGALGWLAKIEAAANDGNWQAAAWKLERRYPKDYGRKHLEITGAEGAPVQIALSDDERADRVAALLESARARRAGPPAEDDAIE